MTHIVRQQHLHVEVNGTESDGLALQRSLPDLCRHWLIPALEQALDRCAPPDGSHLYIEYLEIDAGTLQTDRVEHDLAESVAQAVEKAIREQTLPGASSPNALPPNNTQHKTGQQALLEAFIHFLKTGHLPWSFRLDHGKTLEQMLSDGDEGNNLKAIIFAPGTHSAIISTLTVAAARKRIVRQFSANFVKLLLARLSPKGHDNAVKVLKTIRHSEVQEADIKTFEKYLLENALEQIAIGKVSEESELVATTVHTSPVARLLQGNKALERVLQYNWPDATTKSPTNRKPGRRELSGQTSTGSAQDTIPLELESVVIREGIYIDNAGLVLLHPFLPRFFDALRIANEGVLLQPDRALCLLHFLATGQTSTSEYELVLPKILCNIPVEAPVETALPITETERDEATALLEAVVRHWEALRSTTPDGLRGTFLVRPGKLSVRDDGDWLLQVESKAYDVLMDHLPWGIGMIKLPWMHRMLWVEWGMNG